MPKQEDVIEVQGVVLEGLPNAEFRVKVTSEGFAKEDEDFIVQAVLSGKMKKFNIRILPGDTVTVELSPYDLTRGRITYREK